LHRQLSLNLKKCHLFNKRFEFVGHDIAEDGNHPAESKFDLVRRWPNPTIIRDIAGLRGFCVFYSCYIPFMEVKCQNLRKLCTLEYETKVSPEMWTLECQDEWSFLKNSILSDPCCTQYDPTKRFYLKTNFANVGMGYVGCQPDNHPDSILTMLREMHGSECEFLKNSRDVGAPPRLRPICMGSRCNKGYELRLHLHLDEGFTLDWALGCVKLYCWGSRITSISDCYSLKFIMSYEGNNSVVLRLQMCLMLWAVDIVHRTREFNVDSDYMSKLALDSRFDPLLVKYLEAAVKIRHKYPPPSGEMTDEMMPGFRKKRSIASVPSASDSLPGICIDGKIIDPPEPRTSYISSLFAAVQQHKTMFADSFSIYPISYHTPTYGPIRQFVTTRAQSRRQQQPQPIEPLQNDDVSSCARQLAKYQAILYGLGGGHVYHTLTHSTPDIQIVAAADIDDTAHAFMHETMQIPCIFSRA
jgi:hypothetical protein